MENIRNCYSLTRQIIIRRSKNFPITHISNASSSNKEPPKLNYIKFNPSLKIDHTRRRLIVARSRLANESSTETITITHRCEILNYVASKVTKNPIWLVIEIQFLRFMYFRKNSRSTYGVEARRMIITRWRK